eukprot:1159841-Pelagomonas_calceolata.AAC.8
MLLLLLPAVELDGACEMLPSCQAAPGALMLVLLYSALQSFTLFDITFVCNKYVSPACLPHTSALLGCGALYVNP